MSLSQINEHVCKVCIQRVVQTIDNAKQLAGQIDEIRVLMELGCMCIASAIDAYTLADNAPSLKDVCDHIEKLIQTLAEGKKQHGKRE